MNYQTTLKQLIPQVQFQIINSNQSEYEYGEDGANWLFEIELVESIVSMLFDNSLATESSSIKIKFYLKQFLFIIKSFGTNYRRFR